MKVLVMVMMVVGLGAGGVSTRGVSDVKQGEHDLTGMWRMNTGRSDAPARNAEGELVKYAPGGRWFLPRVFRIGTSDNGLFLSDSTGTILQVVMYRAVAAGDGTRTPPRFEGSWKKDRLIVYRPGRPGTKLVQTFSLEEDKRTLVVKTKMHRAGGKDVEVKRIYGRASP